MPVKKYLNNFSLFLLIYFQWIFIRLILFACRQRNVQRDNSKSDIVSIAKDYQRLISQRLRDCEVEIEGVECALPRNKNIFNHNTHRAFATLRVLSFSWTISYRVGLSASIPLSTRIVLSGAVTTATGSVVSTVFVRPLCSLYMLRVASLLRLNSTHQSHKIQFIFHLFAFYLSSYD